MLFTRLARTKCINGDGGFGDSLPFFMKVMVHEQSALMVVLLNVRWVLALKVGQPVLWKILFCGRYSECCSRFIQWNQEVLKIISPFTLYSNLGVVDSINLTFWDRLFATSKYCQLSSIDSCSKLNKPSLLSELWIQEKNK